MFLYRNMDNYSLITPVTPSYMEHCGIYLEHCGIWRQIKGRQILTYFSALPSISYWPQPDKIPSWGCHHLVCVVLVSRHDLGIDGYPFNWNVKVTTRPTQVPACRVFHPGNRGRNHERMRCNGDWMPTWYGHIFLSQRACGIKLTDFYSLYTYMYMTLCNVIVTQPDLALTLIIWIKWKFDYIRTCITPSTKPIS